MIRTQRVNRFLVMLSEVEASCHKSTFAGFDYSQPDKSTFTQNQKIPLNPPLKRGTFRRDKILWMQ